MLEEVIKIHTLKIHHGSHVLGQNPFGAADKELIGTCGGLPFPSDLIDIFPVENEDAVYVYHSRGSRIADQSDWEGSRIIGYLRAARIELTDGTTVDFDRLNPQFWQGTDGHSGKIMRLHLRYDPVPTQDMDKVKESCPVRPLPPEYK